MLKCINNKNTINIDIKDITFICKYFLLQNYMYINTKYVVIHDYNNIEQKICDNLNSLAINIDNNIDVLNIFIVVNHNNNDNIDSKFHRILDVYNIIYRNTYHQSNIHNIVYNNIITKKTIHWHIINIKNDILKYYTIYDFLFYYRNNLKNTCKKLDNILFQFNKNKVFNENNEKTIKFNNIFNIITNKFNNSLLIINGQKLYNNDSNNNNTHYHRIFSSYKNILIYIDKNNVYFQTDVYTIYSIIKLMYDIIYTNTDKKYNIIDINTNKKYNFHFLINTKYLSVYEFLINCKYINERNIYHNSCYTNIDFRNYYEYICKYYDIKINYNINEITINNKIYNDVFILEETDIKNIEDIIYIHNKNIIISENNDKNDIDKNKICELLIDNIVNTNVIFVIKGDYNEIGYNRMYNFMNKQFNNIYDINTKTGKVFNFHFIAIVNNEYRYYSLEKFVIDSNIQFKLSENKHNKFKYLCEHYNIQIVKQQKEININNKIILLDIVLNIIKNIIDILMLFFK